MKEYDKKACRYEFCVKSLTYLKSYLCKTSELREISNFFQSSPLFDWDLLPNG